MWASEVAVRRWQCTRSPTATMTPPCTLVRTLITFCDYSSSIDWFVDSWHCDNNHNDDNDDAHRNKCVHYCLVFSRSFEIFVGLFDTMIIVLTARSNRQTLTKRKTLQRTHRQTPRSSTIPTTAVVELAAQTSVRGTQSIKCTFWCRLNGRLDRSSSSSPFSMQLGVRNNVASPSFTNSRWSDMASSCWCLRRHWSIRSLVSIRFVLIECQFVPFTFCWFFLASSRYVECTLSRFGTMGGGGGR